MMQNGDQRQADPFSELTQADVRQPDPSAAVRAKFLAYAAVLALAAGTVAAVWIWSITPGEPDPTLPTATIEVIGMT